MKKFIVSLLTLTLALCPIASAEQLVRVEDFKGLQTSPVPSKIEDGAHATFTDVYIKDGNIRSVKGRDRLNSTAHADPIVNGAFYYEATVTSGGGSGGVEGTVTLLHMNGSDASTTFTDDSDSGHTVTANGDAQLDTAQQKFGTASGLFDGTGDYLSIPDSSDWDLGTNDFTIDFWVRFNSVATAFLFDINDGTSNGMYLLYSSGSGTLDLKLKGTASKQFSWSPSADTWYHVAITRDGSDLRAFVDGVQIGSTETSTHNITGGTDGVYIGADVNGATAFNGWLDEFRILAGSAEWTADFSVPTEEYGPAEPIVTNLIKNYVVVETDEIVTYDLDGTNRTSIASSLTNEKWSGVQIGDILYMNSSTNGLYTWNGDGSATAVTAVSAPNAPSLAVSSSDGSLTSGIDGTVVCCNFYEEEDNKKINITDGCSGCVSGSEECAIGVDPGTTTYTYALALYNSQWGIESELSNTDTQILTGDDTFSLLSDDSPTVCNFATTGAETAIDVTTPACASPAPFDKVRIYRTVASGSKYFLVDEAACSDTVTDGKADAVLAEAYDTTLDTITPPSFRYLASYKGVLFAAEDYTIRFTRLPVEATDSANRYWLETDQLTLSSNRTITGMVGLSDSLLIFTKNSIEQITGYGVDSFRLKTLAQGIGAVSHETIEVDTNGDVIVFAGSQGVIKIQFGSQLTDSLTGTIIDRTDTTIRRISSPHMDTVFQGDDDNITIDESTFSSAHAYYDLDFDLYFLYVGNHGFIYDNKNATWTYLPTSKMSASVYRKSSNALGQALIFDNLGFFYNNWTGYENGVESGTVTGNPTSSTGTTLTDSGASFYTTGDGLEGQWVVLDSGGESYQFRRLQGNTATVLTVENAWSTNPTTSDTYYIAYIHPDIRTKQYALSKAPSETDINGLTVVHGIAPAAQTLTVDFYTNKGTTTKGTKTHNLTTAYKDQSKLGLSGRGIWNQFRFRTNIYNTGTSIDPPLDIENYTIHAVGKEAE